MNELIASLVMNAANPAVLFFLIGLAASLLKVELPLPGSFRTALTVYLMAAIGFTGGVAINETGLSAIWLPALVVAGLGAAAPLWLYPIARFLGRLAHADAIALGATYSSVSTVTFASAMSQLTVAGIPFEGAAPAFLAAMMLPGVIVALGLHWWMFFRAERDSAGEGPSGSRGSLWGAVAQVLRAKSVFVLLASLMAGYVAGRPGLALTEGLFGPPFQGLLCLLLLQMGLEAGGRLGALRPTEPFLVGFSILMPLLQGALGVGAGHLTGLSVGGATLLGVLTGSASYLAAPAAVRAMLPQANPSLYITGALGITFPFNVVIGIPLYLSLAQYLAR